jgi:ABC-type multidrug transport system permease subunit
MGCLGLITTFLPKPWRWVAFGVITAYLLIALILPSRAVASQAIELADDLAHLIAFPLGWMSSYMFEIKSKS